MSPPITNCFAGRLKLCLRSALYKCYSIVCILLFSLCVSLCLSFHISTCNVVMVRNCEHSLLLSASSLHLQITVLATFGLINCRTQLICGRYMFLWSSGQSFWLQIQRSRVRFPALPDFLSGSGSGTGYTQPREVN